jgi:cytochrome P450
MNESKGLVAGYPQSMLDILGTCNIAAVHGPSHRLMRGSLLSLISPTMMKDHLLPKIDDFMRNYLCGWDDLETVDIQEKTKHVRFLSFSLSFSLCFLDIESESRVYILYWGCNVFNMSEQFIVFVKKKINYYHSF